MFRLPLCALALTATLTAAHADEPPTPSQQRDRHYDEARRLFKELEWAEAEAAWRRGLALERELSGSDHLTVEKSLLKLSDTLARGLQFAAAARVSGEAADVRARRLGRGHWQTADARVAARHLAKLAPLTIPERERLKDADALLVSANFKLRGGDVRGMGRDAFRAWQTYEAILGDDRETANAAALLGRALRNLGADEQAEPLYERAATLARDLLGDGHPWTATLLDNYGVMLNQRGKLDQAAAAHEKALAAFLRWHGPRNVHTNLCRMNLALARMNSGAARQARELLEPAVPILEKEFGAQAPQVGIALDNLAEVYKAEGDFARAEPTYRRAIDILKRTGPPADYATALNNLGALHARRGDLDRAVELRTRAAKVWKDGGGEDHPTYARLLARLADLYLRADAPEKAEPLVKEAQRLREANLGADHPDTVEGLVHLGELHVVRGEPDRAAPLYDRAVRAARGFERRAPATFAEVLTQAAGFRAVRGDLAGAVRLSRDVLNAVRPGGESTPEYVNAQITLSTFLRSAGQTREARELLQEALSAEERSRGSRTPVAAEILIALTNVSLTRGDWGTAEGYAQRARDAFQAAYGEGHAYVALAYGALSRVYAARGEAARSAEAAAKSEAVLEKAARGGAVPEVVSNHWMRGLLAGVESRRAELEGDFEAALKACRRQVRAEAWAHGSRANAGPDSRLRLKYLEAAVALPAPARQQLREARRLEKQAAEAEAAGKLRSAVELQEQGVAAHRAALGERDISYATALFTLGELLREEGRFAASLQPFDRARELVAELAGHDDESHAACLLSLASSYSVVGDYPRAEDALEQGRRVLKAVQGEDTQKYATCLLEQANLDVSTGRWARAETRYDAARAATARLQGEESLEYARILNNQAEVIRILKRPREAAALLRQALAIKAKNGRTEDVSYARSLNGLAVTEIDLGDPRAAAKRLEEAVALEAKALRPDHPERATALANLAVARSSAGDLPGAVKAARESLHITRGNIATALPGLSDRQQRALLQTMRHRLDGYVSLALRLRPDDPELYSEVLAWKGMLLTRQRQRRIEQAHPEMAGEFERLRELSQRLAALTFAVPGPQEVAAWRKARREVTDEIERCEVAISAKVPEWADRPDDPAGLPAAVAAALPPGTVLVDYLAYLDVAAPRRKELDELPERQLAAFVLAAGQPGVTGHDLGPADAVRNLVVRWRDTFDAADAATLADRVWRPLGARVEAAGTVLVSPDGPLNGFPFAALPGRRPGTYLLHDRPVANVAVPRLIPAWREPAAGTGAPSLLLVGAIDYGAPPEPDGGRAFEPLAAGPAEYDGVGARFGRAFPGSPLEGLPGGFATKDAVRAGAPGKTYLHLSTHARLRLDRDEVALDAPVLGPAPAEGPAAFSLLDHQRGAGDFFPELRTYLATAGANRTAAGRLTGLEIMTWDLRSARLVVLSACQSGLGQEEDGEGLLGLQRAFQVSGARSVVGSLWAVDDATTRTLMDRFYENHWGRGFGPLAALRRAQLTLIDRPVGDSDHPQFWAAWVFSGDPGGPESAADPVGGPTTLAVSGALATLAFLAAVAFALGRRRVTPADRPRRSDN